MNYFLHKTNNDIFLRMEYEYSIQIKKTNEVIDIIKNNLSLEKKHNLDLVNTTSGFITAEDVYTQLANIKHIGFEVTDACNLKCTYCTYGDFYNDYDERTNKQIDSKKAKILINFLVDKLKSSANNSTVSEVIISFYGGEPLLNIDFIKEIVYFTQQLQNNQIKFKYSITTNAIYLKKYIHFLYQYSFTLLISLDGSKENDGHRKFLNGKSSFKVVYENLKYVQCKYYNYFSKNIWFNSVMHNLNNIQEVFSFFQNEFNKTSNLSEINPTGVKPELKNKFNHLALQKPFVKDEKLYAEMERILDLASEESKQLQKFIFQYTGNVYYNYNELLANRDDINYLPTATCIPFSKRIFMTVNNKILPCERIGQQFSLGEVTDDDVKIDCESIAKKYNDYYNSLRNQCASCYLKKSCSQCMYSIKDLESNPICDQVADRQMFDKYLQQNMGILSKRPELYKRIMEEVIVTK